MGSTIINIDNIQDCGVACSVSKTSNALFFDEIQKQCSITFVSLTINYVKILNIFLMQLNCTHGDRFNETIEMYVDTSYVKTILETSCCKFLLYKNLNPRTKNFHIFLLVLLNSKAKIIYR